MIVKMKCSGMKKHQSGQWLLEFKPDGDSSLVGETKTLFVLERDDIEVGKTYEGYTICDMFIPVKSVNFQ